MRINKSKRIIKIIIILIIIMLLCASAYIVNNYRIINDFSNTITDNLKNGICDFNNQSEFIEKVNSANLSDEIKKELLSDFKEEDNPLITTILSNSDIKSSVSPLKNDITIDISAPDMAFFIENYNGDITPETVLEYAKLYCKTADKKDFKFAVHYEKTSGEWIAEYDERAVANAVTGGMADVYDKFVNQWIDEYMTELEKNNEP